MEATALVCAPVGAIRLATFTPFTPIVVKTALPTAIQLLIRVVITLFLSLVVGCDVGNGRETIGQFGD